MRNKKKFYNIVLSTFIIFALTAINYSYGASAMSDALNGGAGSAGTGNNKNPTISSGSSSAMGQALNGGTVNNKEEVKPPEHTTGYKPPISNVDGIPDTSGGTDKVTEQNKQDREEAEKGNQKGEEAVKENQNKGNTSTGSNQKTKNISTIDGVIGAADDFISGAKTDNTIEQKGLQNTIDLIYNILLAIGMVVAVVAGIVLGIQFMTASTEGKAEVKEKLIPYVVGCVVIFGAFGIWKLVMVLIGTF